MAELVIQMVSIVLIVALLPFMGFVFWITIKHKGKLPSKDFMLPDWLKKLHLILFVTAILIFLAVLIIGQINRNAGI